MSPDESDKQFWLETVKEINPAPHTLIPLMPDKPNIEIKQHRQFAVKQEFSTYSKALEDSAFGGIDKATLKKFKQEEFKIEAILDLHGCREDDAFEKVEDFITQSYNTGKRCVIIITGKGALHQQDDIYAPRGILKRQTPQWLNSPRIRAMILVFKNPSERLGGAGALYILLKRKRES
ncbi:MAG: Smr/MutS family protein [Alphaproteobacteria bacterium]|nr:Smr/MutS family protein [Alphaproteobacteria bacterium]